MNERTKRYLPTFRRIQRMGDKVKRDYVEKCDKQNEDLKASVVERFNRTLKTKMYRYFTTHTRILDVTSTCWTTCCIRRITLIIAA